ncbi:MAG: polyprenyl synthetase family protein [Paludibacteraceae bacterium]|nr:polyprenyl synthetase family protein [Paludibacteraceae bacterium]
MITLEQIKQPIQEEFAKFVEEYEKRFETDNIILKQVHQHILQKKGKQIRPILTLLSAKACGEINLNTIRAAIAMEMLHTASLVHDDVVDEAMERRGQKSVNALWNNKISVLAGDYILSESLHTANETKDIDIIGEITQLGKIISKGEILQLSNMQSSSYDENKYLQVIKMKTAALLSACTVTGAISVKAENDLKEKMRQYGEIYGICFQIKDDIFDYVSSHDEIGKPVGNDIKEGKITLPLIYALNNCDPAEKNTILEIIRTKNTTDENIKRIAEFAIEKGGISYAERKMEAYKNEATKVIENIKNKEVADSLYNLLEHTIQRKK